MISRYEIQSYEDPIGKLYRIYKKHNFFVVNEKIRFGGGYSDGFGSGLGSGDGSGYAPGHGAHVEGHEDEGVDIFGYGIGKCSYRYYL
jgi:hypothetical protein